MNEDQEYITIRVEEYKELLMIKGRYEELKTMYYPISYPNINTGIRYSRDGKELEKKREDFIEPYKVTCEE